MKKQSENQFHTSPTFSLCTEHIEGYLCKEVDNKGILRLSRQRHLRYFRIAFNTGKLNIKEDKASTMMRSFLLRDISSVQAISGNPSLTNSRDQPFQKDFNQHQPRHKVLSRSMIEKKYKIEDKTWPFGFLLEYGSHKHFRLSARTAIEF